MKTFTYQAIEISFPSGTATHYDIKEKIVLEKLNSLGKEGWRTIGFDMIPRLIVNESCQKVIVEREEEK